MPRVTSTSRDDFLERGARQGDTLLAVLVIGILFVILVPLPPPLIDVLLILNVTVSLMILMATASVSRPVEFSAFPSLLLIVTFFRLAVNVATTRLILGNAGERGMSAAGEVVRAFASFVAGSSVIVGVIVFAIIVVVQFVVITRGTTRISEVAARFTLDAMPGKQLSVDGDFSAGLISEDEAKRRRRELNQEADFFGAMDGASKFVRGEAIASLVITLTNMLGGLTLGVMKHSMGIGGAADVFGRLTIGDGLVTQVPALMISVATALLITRSSGREGLGTDLGRQLFADARIFFAAAAFLLVLLPSGLPKGVLLAGAVVCGGLGLLLRGGGESAIPEEEPEAGEVPAVPRQSPEERVRSLLVLEPIELEIGYRLVWLVDASQGGNLMPLLARVRERIAADLGLVVPPVKVRDNTRLHPGDYCVRLRGGSVGKWRVRPGRLFAVTEGETMEGVDGIPEIDPSTGKPGLWVVEAQSSTVAKAGYPIRRAAEIITDHLDRLIRAHAAEILTREEVSRLISDLRSRAPALVDELIPNILKIGEVHKVLQNLLREQVSIRNLEMILEVLVDHGERTRDTAEICEYVRRAVARSICGPLSSPDGIVYAALLDPALEEFLQSSVEMTERGSRLAIEPEMAETLVESINEVLVRMEAARFPPVLVTSVMIRRHLRDLLAPGSPSTAVLAYEEVVDDFRLESYASVSLEMVGQSR